jgi:hypothetical protein
MLIQVGVIFSGLIITLVIGFGVSYVLDKTVELLLPPWIDPEVARQIEEAMKYGEKPKKNPGRWLGIFEQILFFASIWLEAYVVIAGWLAFKLGSKWQTWQHIIKMPDNIVGNDGLLNLRIMSACGSYQMSRFLIGSLYNVLCGLAGVTFGKTCLRLLCPPFWQP